MRRSLSLGHIRGFLNTISMLFMRKM